MFIKIKRLKAEAKLPSYAHPGDAGLDLYSLEDAIIDPGQQKIFFIGFALEFDNGYVGLIKDKSSLAKAGLHVLGGVFDAGYRGEYNVQLFNLSSTPYSVQAGDKIAQLVIAPVAKAELKEVEDLTDSSRGEGRFGSSGKN